VLEPHKISVNYCKTGRAH